MATIKKKKKMHQYLFPYKSMKERKAKRQFSSGKITLN
jgi:hypothetical protein